MKTFGMLLLMALSTSPALAQQDDQKMPEVGGSTLGEAGIEIRARLAGGGRVLIEGMQAGYGASQPMKATRAKNGIPLPKTSGSS